VTDVNISADERARSNRQARSTWERRAVGAHHAKAPKGTAEYFEQIRAYRYGYETPFIPDFFQFRGLNGKRVLEIGVGNGIDGVEMMRHGAIYTGIDITRNHLSLTRRYVDLEQQQGRALRVEALVEGDLLETELPGGYDVAYSFGVLHHIAHEEDTLRRIRQLLAPGGELRLAVYSRFSFFNAWMIATWLLRNRMRNTLSDWQSHKAEASHLGDPVVIRIRGRRGVQRLLERTGFEVMSYGRRGFVTGYLPGVGRFLKADGATVRGFASVLGWYHCFVCRPRA
jgi:2-polyprenyl-3-methyl-5-hydroxy-6-metoxy-1,4-benzoquinol methylase